MKKLLLVLALLSTTSYADVGTVDAYIKAQGIPIDGINSDGMVWCSQCTPDQLTQAQNIIAASSVQLSTPTADPVGFAAAIKQGLGGIIAANGLMTIYPAFFPAVQGSQWADVQALILDAQGKGVLNPTQYAAIQQAAVTYNIPITLP